MGMLRSYGVKALTGNWHENTHVVIHPRIDMFELFGGDVAHKETNFIKIFHGIKIHWWANLEGRNG